MSEYNYNKRMYYDFSKHVVENPFFLAAILNLSTIPEVVITNKVTCPLGNIKPDKMTSLSLLYHVLLQSYAQKNTFLCIWP